MAYPLLESLRSVARFNVLAPEYPGYGTYKQTVARNKDDKAQSIGCSSTQLKEDADCVYDFILANFKNIKESDIIIYGRSMGTGPVVYLASSRQPGAVVLMSAYTSIKRVVKEKFSFLSALVNEHFDNLALADKIRSPTLLIHGEKDELIHYSHSEELCGGMTNCSSHIITPCNMTHNGFDFFKNLIKPLLKFMEAKCEMDPFAEEEDCISLSDIFYIDQDFGRLVRRERMKK